MGMRPRVGATRPRRARHRRPTSAAPSIVDGNGLTSVEGVYAVGDLAGGMMLASTASMQGRHAAFHALGAGDRGARST